MNIAVITSCCLSRDGVGNAIKSLIESLNSSGNDVTLFHMDEKNTSMDHCDSRFISPGEILFEQTVKGTFPADTQPFFRNESVHRHFYDHDLFIFEFIFSYPLLELCETTPPERTVFHYHGITPPRMFCYDDPYRRLANEALSKHYFLKNAKTILVHSNYMKRYLENTVPETVDRICVVPISVSQAYSEAVCQTYSKATIPGTDERAIAPVLDDRCSVFGHRSPDFQLIYTGRISGNKEVHTILKALRILKDSDNRYTHTKLIVVGAHSRKTTSTYERELVWLIHRLKLSRDISFVSDVDDRTLAHLYTQSHLFVTASIHEGFCIPVAEAMTCGTPVVAADGTATIETMGEGGLSFSQSSPQECARAINEALQKDTWSRLSQNAKIESGRFTSKALSRALDPILKTWSLEINSGASLKTGNSALTSISRLIFSTRELTPVYGDNSHKRTGTCLRWLRRKITLPLEVSVLRRTARAQSAINSSIAEELSSISNELKELREKLNPEH